MILVSVSLRMHESGKEMVIGEGERERRRQARSISPSPGQLLQHQTTPAGVQHADSHGLLDRGFCNFLKALMGSAQALTLAWMLLWAHNHKSGGMAAGNGS